MSALLAIFGTSFVIAFSGAAMPGPVMTATISESARRGPVAGPLIVAGHAVLELVLVILIMLGLAPFLQKGWVFATIALVGSLMLARMAWSMFRSIPSLSIHADVREQTGANLMVTGAVLSLSTPYWTLWWATIGLGYILYSARLGPAGVAVFFVGHILGDLVWYSAISLAIGKGRKFLSDRSYRVIIGSCAAFLLALACWFAWSGMHRALTL
ncbi:MAG TPA: LysE family transporter [Deltaproteobacteria bacterium]|jgi:threonine/homoserine/homoserine lactone efflux protein|nr:LysE family transporter [Deltaproteobacteria bacterium]OQC22646.1 MAG: LysE type translocator [Deltaproteobacteria bacterium ADurb.Bin072]HRW80364.1 LysE family transporter [Desulfomonilia bacterium]HNQ85370.1 LysE family transporter [Deltaproteobacteria bacterium]HNS89382.1 LysE family transporter [Deltaproteobacteria bacterium]